MSTQTKQSKGFVDFSKLNEKELDALSTKWERAAMFAEIQWSRSPSDDLFKRANGLWRRLAVLERYRRKGQARRTA